MIATMERRRKRGERRHPGLSVRAERGPRRLLTVAQLCDYLGISRSQLCRTTVRLEIPFVKLTEKGCEYFDIHDVDAWIEKRKTGGAGVIIEQERTG